MRDELQEAGEICCACFRVFGLLGVKISSFGLKAQGSGSRAHGLGFWALGSGLGVQGTKVPSKSMWITTTGLPHASLQPACTCNFVN